MDTIEKTRDTGEHQRKVGELVSREVYCSVSMLISELSQNDKYMDEILEFSVSYPEFGRNGLSEGRCRKCLGEGAEITRGKVDSDYDTCEDCFEPDAIEALEFWIVSDWLADRLEEKGKMITRDFLGLTIWGRTTSGQAILIDGVINEIYEEMMAK